MDKQKIKIMSGAKLFCCTRMLSRIIKIGKFYEKFENDSKVSEISKSLISTCRNSHKNGCQICDQLMKIDNHILFSISNFGSKNYDGLKFFYICTIKYGVGIFRKCQKCTENSSSI